MRICSRCAAQMAATEFTCRLCGGTVSQAIADGTGSVEQDQPPNLLAPPPIPDVEKSNSRRGIEVGFYVGIVVMVGMALWCLSGSLTSDDPRYIVGCIVLLITSPLLGLLFAI